MLESPQGHQTPRGHTRTIRHSVVIPGSPDTLQSHEGYRTPCSHTRATRYPVITSSPPNALWSNEDIDCRYFCAEFVVSSPAEDSGIMMTNPFCPYAPCVVEELVQATAVVTVIPRARGALL